MKKIVSLLLTIIMIVSMCGVPVYAADNVKVKLCNYIDSNGKWVGEKYIKFDVQPQIIDGRTMVPIRAVAEALGYEVTWNDSEKEIDISADIYSEYGKFRDKKSWENVTQYKDMVWLLYRLEKGEKVANFSTSGNYNRWGMKESQKWEYVDDIIYGNNRQESIGIGALLKVNSKNAYSSIWYWYGKECCSLVYKYTMDVPPKIIDGRTLVPLRAVGDMLGLQVSWNDATKTVTLKA